MIPKSVEIREKFPVRKSAEQKGAFIECVTAYAKELGYAVSVDSYKRGARNIIIGNHRSAKYLITAHYDTPASIGLPNFITPNNPVTFIAIQLALVAVLLTVAFAVGFAVYGISGEEKAALLAGYIVYFVILLLMLKGPANRNNANDNTSGVVTVLEILSVTPEELRDRVSFVLFDMEEGGLIGSALFRKRYKETTENQVVLNLDCVGDGDIIQLTPVKKARKDQALLESLSKICGKTGVKELRLRSSGFYGGASDHKNFPKGVAVMAFHYKKGIGLYCGRIHTWRDTILEEENVNILRDSLITLITENAAQ